VAFPTDPVTVRDGCIHLGKPVILRCKKITIHWGSNINISFTKSGRRGAKLGWDERVANIFHTKVAV
jgi:hypothetical protein